MRIAIFGAGWAGRTHAAAYREIGDVEIAAVVGRDPARTNDLASRVNAPGVTDVAKVLENDSIDAVDVCYPSALHRQVAVPALDAGKHVFMETPMALTLEDADAMLDAAKRNDRILAVGQLMKFVTPYALIQEAVAKGELGRPRFVHAARLSPPYWTAKNPRDFDVYGDPMVELMIFEYEYLHWLVGSPRDIHAVGVRGPRGVVQHALVTLAYDGCTALVEGSAMMPGSWPFTTYLRVQGEAGGMETRGRFLGGIPETTFTHFPPERPFREVPFEGQDPYAAECAEFVRSVIGGREPQLTDAVNAREALRVALAARELVTD